MVSERESLAMLENSLRETLQKEATESDKRRKAMEIQKEVWEQHRQVLKPAIIPSGKSYGEKEEEVSMSAMTSLRAKEQEIEKRKLEVSEKVQAHLSRVEEEARRLDQIRREEMMTQFDATRHIHFKKIEVVDRELKPLKQTCDRKEREYKEAVEAFNEKSRLKTELITSLMEIVTQSEKLRMRKLDELNRHIESMR